MLNKSIIIIIFLDVILLHQSNLFAQEETKKADNWRIAISTGVAYTQKKFAETSNSASFAGHAKNGQVNNLELQYHVNNSIYISSMFRSQVHETDYGHNLSISATDWKIRSLFLGFGSKIKLSKRFLFNTKFMLSYSTIRSPSVRYSDISALLLTNSSTSREIAYACGMNFSYSLSKRIDIFIGADYFYSFARFNEVVVETSFTSGSNWTRIQEDQYDIDIINTNIGLSYKF